MGLSARRQGGELRTTMRHGRRAVAVRTLTNKEALPGTQATYHTHKEAGEGARQRVLEGARAPHTQRDGDHVGLEHQLGAGRRR